MAFLQISTEPVLPIFFNVNQNVGNRGAPNGPEDAALVSFLLVKWAEKGPRVPESVKAAARPVIPGPYTPALQTLIDTLQTELKKQHPTLVADGHISRAPPGATYSGGTFIICMANYQVATAFKQQWPRLDTIPGCPPQVKALIDRVVLAT